MNKYSERAKKLITGGHLIHFETVATYNNVSPALILYFDNHSPMVISQDKWSVYSDLIIQTLKNY